MMSDINTVTLESPDGKNLILYTIESTPLNQPLQLIYIS